MIMFSNFPKISIVVIGYNEEENLENTFQAILNMNYPQDNLELIYVDSGSKDNSVNIAKTYTDRIFIEDKYPSPGRNRNRGLVESQYDIVHFVDGDVIINNNYLRSIVGLFEEKKAQAIVGQLDEQEPNIFNKLASLANAEKKEGYTNFTSTGATYLRYALLSVNGYDERIRRGQESELGERFKKSGYNIWCTRYSMGSHNFGINNLWEYLIKYEINARSMLQLALLNGDSMYIKSAKGKILKQTLKLFVFVVAVFLSVLYDSILFLLFFLILAWVLRVKGLYKNNFMKEPLLVFIRSIIDFFFYWKWWFGFFKELFKFLFVKSARDFYKLNKMQLNS